MVHFKTSKRAVLLAVGQLKVRTVLVMQFFAGLSV